MIKFQTKACRLAGGVNTLVICELVNFFAHRELRLEELKKVQQRARDLHI